MTTECLKVNALYHHLMVEKYNLTKAENKKGAEAPFSLIVLSYQE